MLASITFVYFLACNGGKNGSDSAGGDADTDSDTDSDTDTDTDTDTDSDADTDTDTDTDTDVAPDADKDGYDASVDCDDSDASVYPGATPEICWDGIDTNCDGSALGCTGSAADANAGYFGESASDEASMSAAAGVDLDGDGDTEVLIGARSDDDGGDDAGAAYLIRGPVSSGVQNLSTATTKLTGGAASDRAGRVVAFAGDLDGDGTQDIAVSASLQNSTATDAGSVHLIADTSLGSGSFALDTVDWAVVNGNHQYDYFGTGLLGDVDTNGDGTDDLWIGATGDDSGGADAGSVFLVLGPLTDSTSLGGSHAAELTGNAAGRNVGTALAGGDFDGDGFDDLAIGDLYDNTSGYRSGAVWLFAGPVSVSAALSTADAMIASDAGGDSLGISVSGAGDLDGDGYDDLVAGAPVAGTTGKAYVFAGTSPLSSWTGSASTAASAIFGAGAADVASVGMSVAAGGDFDGDGTGDFLVGASTSGSSSQGAAFLIAGPAVGSVSLDEGSGNVLLRIDGEAANDQLGAAGVSFTGPIASGAAEGLMISSSTLDTSATDAGGSYIIWNVDL